MSMVGKMFGHQIEEGETALEEIDKGLTEAEAKILPFLTKFGPVAEKVVGELVELSPTLKGVVTATEIAEFGQGIGALPGLMTAMHARIQALEAELKKV